MPQTQSQSSDALTAMENEAKRQRMEKDAAKAISDARSRLVLSKDRRHCFFAVLALRLRPKAVWDSRCPTAATDGKWLYYNPAFIVSLPRDQVHGLLVHAVMHPALCHHVRRGTRNPKKWNIAADAAINPMIRDAGFSLPPSGIFPGEGKYEDLPPGLCAEEYYSILPDEQDGDGDGDGDEGDGDPGGCGAVWDAGDESEQKASEAEWKVATMQAAEIAKQRGALPAGIEQLVDEIANPAVNWRDVLRRFVQQTARNDYAWSPPNRRFIHIGMYLPSTRSEELGRVVLVVDTSGSISDQTLEQFAGECQAVLESYDCTAHIIYHDASVQHEQEWTPTDGPLEFEPKGRGGTNHRPVFERVDEDEPPTCMICLTDGYTSFPDEEPCYPVLWAMTTDVVAPFGETVKIEV